MIVEQTNQGAVAGFRIVGHRLLAGAALPLQYIAFEGDRVDVVALNFGEKLRVVDRRRGPRPHPELAENRQQNDR
jgi:hypothetical protein